jgi:hypothetical protein
MRARIRIGRVTRRASVVIESPYVVIITKVDSANLFFPDSNRVCKSSKRRKPAVITNICQTPPSEIGDIITGDNVIITSPVRRVNGENFFEENISNTNNAKRPEKQQTTDQMKVLVEIWSKGFAKNPKKLVSPSLFATMRNSP